MVVNHQFQAVITIGEGNMAEVVVSLKIGILQGNNAVPQYDGLVKVFADGLRMAAERKGLI